MKNATITGFSFRDFRKGDVIYRTDNQGREWPMKIIRVDSDTTMTARKLRCYERIWQYIKEH